MIAVSSFVLLISCESKHLDSTFFAGYSPMSRYSLRDDANAAACAPKISWQLCLSSQLEESPRRSAKQSYGSNANATPQGIIDVGRCFLFINF